MNRTFRNLLVGALVGLFAAAGLTAAPADVAAGPQHASPARVVRVGHRHRVVRKHAHKRHHHVKRGTHYHKRHHAQ